MKEIFDVEGPANAIERKVLEIKGVQQPSVKWWLSHNPRGKDVPKPYWARKFSSPAQRSVPDYLFAAKKNPSSVRKFAIEFKAPGKTSTPAQVDEQQKMRDAGWDVYECDSVEKFKEIAARYL